MKQKVYIFLVSILLATVQTVSAQSPSAASEKEQLVKDMYHQFLHNEYKALKVTVARLKEICLQDGDEKTFYKAWGNEVQKGISFNSRNTSMQHLKELRDYATLHNSKYGLYTVNYVTATIMNQTGDSQDAIKYYNEAADILNRHFPEESRAPIYNSLANISIQKKQDSLAVVYSRMALADPHINQTHRILALSNICIAWGWKQDKKQFDQAYAQLKEALGQQRTASETMLKVEMFRHVLNKDYDEAIKTTRQMKSKLSQLLYPYKIYEWQQDYQNAFFAFRNYRYHLDTLNTSAVRNQAALYRAELNVAKAENEAKDLRLANQKLQLDQVSAELKQHQLEAEATELRLKNSDIELAHAAIKLQNDSLDRQTQVARLSEMQSKMEAQQNAEHAQRILIFAAAAIALLTIAYLAFYLHRRQQQMKRLRSAYDQLEETTTAKERIESELRIARDIQLSMVPHVFPERKDVDIYATLNPAKAVGGDLYDYFIQDEKLYFCIGDVSGKGVPASMLMSVAINLFRMTAKEGFPPEYIATKLNDTLSADNDNGMFITAFIGMIDLQTGRLNYCNAGHNPPVLDGRFLDMEANAPLGLWPNLEYQGETIKDIRGQQLFLYTDGLNEAENPAQEQFGDDRLLSIIQQHPFSNAQQTIARLHWAVAKFIADAEPSDDLTMLCIKVS